MTLQELASCSLDDLIRYAEAHRLVEGVRREGERVLVPVAGEICLLSERSALVVLRSIVSAHLQRK